MFMFIIDEFQISISESGVFETSIPKELLETLDPIELKRFETIAKLVHKLVRTANKDYDDPVEWCRGMTISCRCLSRETRCYFHIY